ncbi:MAG: hypothetical protein H6599_09150 [Flavobacteriales bacterium]|nr:hypothetical protein [Flavobacteriales bacterium]
MKKSNYIFTFLLVIIELSNSYGQYLTDFGLNIGASNYLGEIGGKADTRRDFIFDMKLEQTKPSYGAFIRHRFNESYGITTTLTFANIAGTDAITSNPARKERNLSFSNMITELSARGEYYFYTIHDVGNHGRYWVNFRPYFFAGLGIFHHAPKTEYKGEVYNLRPLQTEGVNYSLLSVSIPAGLGFYFTYKNRYRVSFEMCYRKTFTDYLDDISSTFASDAELNSDLAIDLANRNDEIDENTSEIDPHNYEAGSIRGNASDKDAFLTTHFGISYVLRGAYKNIVVTRGPVRPKIIRKTRIKF